MKNKIKDIVTPNSENNYPSYICSICYPTPIHFPSCMCCQTPSNCPCTTEQTNMTIKDIVM